MNRYVRVLIYSVCVFLLVSCANRENKSNVYPLTGTNAEKAVVERPIAVMVNNHPKARPQSGLSKADVVIEALSEGSITRFLAIYQSEMPEVVGPVRSAREYFIELALGFNALYVHHGWSPGAREMLEGGAADYINGLNDDGSTFWRADFRKAPHNSYTSFKNIKKAAGDKGYSLESHTGPLSFQTDETTPDEAPVSVRFNYGTNQVKYRFDQNVNGYVRKSDGILTTDMETEEPIVLQNILIVEAEHQVKDHKGRRNIDLRSGGQGLLLSGGQLHKVSWKNENGRIVPVMDGNIVPFVPGKTWINIIPDLREVSISKGEGV
ncbi:DUF3048 domain-containing protein [Bacillus changyiensis]|uniref:DUF3048 domain-containing protein n=1 Tax=Bacillus changyiensis TaxID=3004103 RepID=UPI0022E0F50B|nr:DUF3048 domain-containing protein [Bacillus changyiensis]MDA1477115.1 DUF3048 domain-containing protein [Bacillus changyiensis]